MNGLPRVTVGVPVYNGARTISEALHALLNQTYRDTEFLVSDNASTDATADIVREIAHADPRVRLVVQPCNMGANGNYSYVAKHARGEFLKWSSASDWCAPTFIERCVETLDANPDAVVAVPRTRFFEGSRDNATDSKGDIAILGDRPSVRLMDWYERTTWNNALNGLIRLDALRKTALVPPYMGSDTVLMGHLALLGRIVLVDEPLFYRRMDVDTTIMRQDLGARVRHHYPNAGARSLLQVWKRQAGWFHAAAAAPMPLGERLRVFLYLTRRSYWDKAKLGHDLGAALKYVLGRRP